MDAPDTEALTQAPPDPIFPPPLPVPPVRTLVWRAIGDLAAALGLTLAVAIPAGMIFGFSQKARGGGVPASGLPVEVTIFLFFAQECLFAAFGLRRMRVNKRSGLGASLSEGNVLRAILLGVPAGLILLTTGAIFAKLVGGTSPRGIAELLSGLLANRWAAFAVFLVVAVIGPVCEEIMFRGAIFGFAHANGRTWAGAAVASVLFAVVHLNFRMTPYYLIFSVVNCWLLTKTKTLAGPIAAHMTVNSAACLAILLPAGTGH